jgi:fatty acid desaturase
VTRPRRRSDDSELWIVRIVLTGLVFVLIEIGDYYVFGDVLAWWVSLLLAVFVVGGGSVLIFYLED